MKGLILVITILCYSAISFGQSGGNIFINDIYGTLISILSLDIHQNEMTLNTGDWTAGAYIISLEFGGQTGVLKAVKY